MIDTAISNSRRRVPPPLRLFSLFFSFWALSVAKLVTDTAQSFYGLLIFSGYGASHSSQGGHFQLRNWWPILLNQVSGRWLSRRFGTSPSSSLFCISQLPNWWPILRRQVSGMGFPDDAARRILLLFWPLYGVQLVADNAKSSVGLFTPIGYGASPSSLGGHFQLDNRQPILQSQVLGKWVSASAAIRLLFCALSVGPPVADSA